jgi:hypothetical protein
MVNQEINQIRMNWKKVFLSHWKRVIGMCSGFAEEIDKKTKALVILPYGIEEGSLTKKEKPLGFIIGLFFLSIGN